jgi:phosphoserine phosphatase RsbU/P
MVKISSILNLLIELIKSMAVVIVLAYFLTRTKLYANTMTKGKTDFWQKLCLVMIFGLFSIYGTLSGIPFGGAIANIRDLGPAIAGLIGGPAVGLAAGLIGGVHRYLFGGITYIPCSISTVVAGLAGGLIHQYKKNKFVSMPEGAVFMALMETFHMTLVLLIVRPFSQALIIVEGLALPMIFTNALGIGTFIFIIHNLEKENETLHAKERIAAELNVATQIQSSMMPCTFPAFPDRSEFDIYAAMKPAREVGGDFYDFFLIDEDHFAVVMADVSGKGIPAALFMMTAKTLIKNQTQLAKPPAEAFTAVNEQLCENNEAGMFVTAFMGVLEISSGRFTYVNAGHNAPLIKKPDGSFEWLKAKPGFVLGGMEGIKYRQAELTFEKNDLFFTYTDGVTEALDQANNLYGDNRLISTLNSKPTDKTNLRDLLDYLQSDIVNFSSGAEQADDITMLVLKYTGSE